LKTKGRYLAWKIEVKQLLTVLFLIYLKLHNFLWQGFHVSYAVNAAPECALSNSVANWSSRMFGRISQWGAEEKKSEWPDTLAPNWGWIFPESVKKELNFETALLPLLFPYK
jgi:hypothetical protein